MSELPRMGDPDEVADLPSWAEVQPAYRADWERRNAATGRIWTDVELGYQFAYEAYRSPRYRGRGFATISRTSVAIGKPTARSPQPGTRSRPTSASSGTIHRAR